MDVVYLFDYDETLLFKDDSSSIPIKEVTNLVKEYKRAYNVPFIVITAGSVNFDCDSTERVGKGFYPKVQYIRPYELFRGMCGLDATINEFNPNADVCIFGKYVAKNKYRLPLRNNVKYVDQGHDLYVPSFQIGENYYRLLDENHSKKISILFHLLVENGLKPFLILVDDADHHDFSGLEDMVIDTFETAPSMYHLTHPIKSDKDSIMRVMDLTNAIKNNMLNIYLSRLSISVWKRFEHEKRPS